MAKQAPRGSGASVLVVASEREVQELRSRLDGVAVIRAAPARDAKALALASGARCFVWLGRDPDIGLRSVLELRSTFPEMTILFVTPREAERTRIAALDGGVDDVIAGPLSITELAARVRLMRSRVRMSTAVRLLIAERLELDLDRQQLLRDGTWVHLRPKEAQLLELLARAPGKALSRDYILEQVWGPHHVGDARTVDVHVRWLRAKIEPRPHAPVRLVTVRGVGYRLEGWRPAEP